MMPRIELHALVDTLPETAFENARRMLEHLITPPPMSPEMERIPQIRQEQMERMRQSIRPFETMALAHRKATLHEMW